MPARNGSDDLERDLLDLSEAGGEEIAPSAELRETLLASLAAESRFAGFVRRVATFLDLGPEDARRLLDRVAEVDGPAWEDGRVEGVRLHHFSGGPRLADAHCGLVSVEPGLAYPHHRHRGDEWSFVLRGRAREDSGRVWAAGDLVRSSAGSGHSFTVLGSEPFVFVVVVHGGVEHDPQG